MYKIILLPLFLTFSSSMPSSFLEDLKALPLPKRADEIQRLEKDIIEELESMKNEIRKIETARCNSRSLGLIPSQAQSLDNNIHRFFTLLKQEKVLPLHSSSESQKLEK